MLASAFVTDAETDSGSETESVTVSGSASAVACLHRPVLVDEVLDLLAVRPGGLYCDATVGSAGHAELILERSAPTGRLVALDRDVAAVERARRRLAGYGDRATILQGNFAEVRALLDGAGVDACDGILLDVGLSSEQLAEAARGFSLARSGPLDMRMDPASGPTAGELLDRLSADELAELLARLGEQPAPGRVARAIIAERRAGRILTTTDLAHVVARAFSRRGRIHPATRVFQALRIAVNDELGALARILDAAPDCLRPGGRLVVIAFHSLEDRIVKRSLAGGAAWRVLTRKPVRPERAEVIANPRARSARLRAAERIG